MRCEKCKYSSVVKNKVFLSCSNDHFKEGYHYSDDEILDGEVLIENDEGWGFFVTSSFGCVHFEERTAEH